MAIRNPFRDPVLRKNFDAVIGCYRTRHPDIWRPPGQARPGNAWSNNFWRGYNNVMGGIQPPNWDSYSRKTPAYACFRAGQAVAREEQAVVETIKAMRAARRGELVTVGSPDDLLAELNKDT